MTSPHMKLYRKCVSYVLLAVMTCSTAIQPLYAAVYDNPLDKWLTEHIEKYKNKPLHLPVKPAAFILSEAKEAEELLYDSPAHEKENNPAYSGHKKDVDAAKERVKKPVQANKPFTKGYKTSDENTVYADIASGFIGYDSKTGIADDPSDNVFHFDIKTISHEHDYMLTYDVKGIENTSGIITGLNENPSEGGKLIKKSDNWVQHTRLLDKNYLKKGFNYVLFNAPATVSVPYEVKNVRIVLAPKAEQAVRFDDQPGHFYFHDASLYIKGRVQDVYAGYELRINNQAVNTKNGYFDQVITFEGEVPEALAIQLYKGNDIVYSTTEEVLSLTKADMALKGANNQVATRSLLYQPEQAYTLNAFGAGIELPAYMLDSDTTISISQLRSVDMAPLGGALFNVTKNRMGYRLLPDGLRFSGEGKIAVSYAKQQLPAGYSEADIQIFYFDVYSKS